MFFRNAKVGDLPKHKFEIDIELEGKAEEVCFWTEVLYLWLIGYWLLCI